MKCVALRSRDAQRPKTAPNTASKATNRAIPDTPESEADHRKTAKATAIAKRPRTTVASRERAPMWAISSVPQVPQRKDDAELMELDSVRRATVELPHFGH